MKVYKVDRKEENRWDTYDSTVGFVVVARSAVHARSITQEEGWGDWAYDEAEIETRYVGEAGKRMKAGVVLESRLNG